MLPLALALGCSTPEPVPLVVLVSWDTTRADALSCYGAQGGLAEGSTPVADALAARGVRFEMALAQSPTTLASHATVMSGLDTHGHGVVRNGFPVPAEPPLLAERLAAAGWDTLAVVGAFPLEADMGLARGFRVYRDHGWLGFWGKYAVPGDTVTEHALDEIDGRRAGAPVFLFVHYFDAHRPWVRAPAELQARFVDPAYDGPAGALGPAEPDMQYLTDAAVEGRLSAADARYARARYLAEVAWNDVNLGLLLDGLAERRLLDDALVVLTADHGEVLDEVAARPYRHGPDVDLAAIRVPLIVAGTGRFATPAGRVVERQVRLQDVGATVLAAAGVPGGLGSGEDLGPLWAGGEVGPAPLAFAEATMPHEATAAEGWPNLPLERGVASEGHLFTRAPWLGEEALYRLAPDQPPADDPARAAVMGALLDTWDAGAPGHRASEMDARTEDGLRALGYLE